MNPPDPTPAIGPELAGSASRRPELDGIRGLAILMVMAYHFLSLSLINADASWAVALGKSMKLGWTGVDLFFVLSGFLIGGLLLHNRNATNYFSVFFIRRACRIWPLYFVILMLFLGVRAYTKGAPGFEALDLGPIPLWTYFVFLQNIWMAISHTFGSQWLSVTWSLAVEEQFYLILPFMVRFLPTRRLVYVSLCGIVGAVVLRMVLRPDFVDYVSFPTRADSVLAGLLLAIGVRMPQFRKALDEHFSVLLTLVALGAVGMVILTVNDRLLGDGLFLWTTMFYTGIMALLVTGRPRILYRFMTMKWLQFVGLISYGLYLFHLPAGWVVLRFLSFPPEQKNHPLTLFTIAGCSALLTLVAAVICHFGFERAFVRMGHRLSYQRP